MKRSRIDYDWQGLGDSEMTFRKCPKCGIRLLAFMTGESGFMCDNCGAYSDLTEKNAKKRRIPGKSSAKAQGDKAGTG